MIEDAELLRRYARDHSEAAFAELVQRRLNFVYAAALRQVGGDAHRAQDVTQAVFTDLARKAAALTQHRVLAGWLFTSTRFAAAKAVRGERRRQIREREAQTMHELTSDSVPVTDWEQLRPVIDDALQALKERDRQAVLLRFFEGRAFPEVGTKLAVTDDAARLRVERALEKMRIVLARRGVTSTTTALAVALANQPVVAVSAAFASTVTGAALAGATSGGLAATIAIFMSTAKITTGIAAVLAILAIGSAVYEAGKVRKSAASLSDVSREREVLRAQVGAVERDLAGVQTESDELKAKMATLAAQKSVPPTSQSRAGQAGSGAASGRPDLNDPEIFRLWREQNRAGMRIALGSFFRAAALSPEQQDRLVAAIEEPALTKRDISESLKAALKSPNPPTEAEANALAAKLGEKSSREMENKLRTLLGDDGLEKFQWYFATTAERDVANRIAGQVYYTDAPLSGDQADQLVRVLAKNKFLASANPDARSTVGGVAITEQLITTTKALATQQGMPWFALITDGALAQADNVLSPAQAAALRQLQAQQATELKLIEVQLRKSGGH